MQISDLIRALSAFDPELPVVVPADGSDGTIDFTLVEHVALDLFSRDAANPANLQLSDKRDRDLFEAIVLSRRSTTR